MKEKIIFTSESVGRGHPDKVCDQISDRILDSYISLDPDSKVACEVMATAKNIYIGGEITSSANVDLIQQTKSVLLEVGLNPKDFKIQLDINKQSPQIRDMVVKSNGEVGAGDQGIMFGYACKQTKQLMPLPITIAHKLVEKIESFRVSNSNKFFKSDCKSQVSIDYSDTSNPRIDNIVISAQHFENIDMAEFKDFVTHQIIIPVAKQYNMNLDFKCHINSVGPFTIGGPEGDTGLTGRKIIVDTYGGYAKHGGGAFSGKDPTKMDRSACYAARWIAKNIVAAGLCDEIEIQLSYVIGHIQPISIHVNSFRTNKIPESLIIQTIRNVFDLSPLGIIRDLDLKKPLYFKTSFFGHFGREDQDLSWERLDKVSNIKKYLSEKNIY